MRRLTALRRSAANLSAAIRSARLLPAALAAAALLASTALVAPARAQQPQFPDNLEGFFPFDDGTNPTNEIVHDQDANLSGQPRRVGGAGQPGGIAPLRGNADAFVLNGSTDFMTTVRHERLSFQQNFSVAIWIRREADKPVAVLVAKDAAGGQGTNYRLALVENRFAFSMSFADPNVSVAQAAFGGGAQCQNGTCTVIAASPVPINEWHHLAAVYDASSKTIVLYVDGRRAAEVRLQVPTGANGAANDQPVTIGAAGGGRPPAEMAFFQGRVDELCMFSKALAESEVVSLTQARCLVGVGASHDIPSSHARAGSHSSALSHDAARSHAAARSHNPTWSHNRDASHTVLYSHRSSYSHHPAYSHNAWWSHSRYYSHSRQFSHYRAQSHTQYYSHDYTRSHATAASHARFNSHWRFYSHNVHGSHEANRSHYRGASHDRYWSHARTNSHHAGLSHQRWASHNNVVSHWRASSSGHTAVASHNAYRSSIHTAAASHARYNSNVHPAARSHAVYNSYVHTPQRTHDSRGSTHGQPASHARFWSPGQPVHVQANSLRNLPSNHQPAGSHNPNVSGVHFAANSTRGLPTTHRPVGSHAVNLSQPTHLLRNSRWGLPSNHVPAGSHNPQTSQPRP